MEKTFPSVNSFFPWNSDSTVSNVPSLITRFMGLTWDPSGADRTQVGPMLTPWTLLSGLLSRPFPHYMHCDLRLFFFIIKKLNWFKQWFGAVRPKAFTWTHVDHQSHRHLASHLIANTMSRFWGVSPISHEYDIVRQFGTILQHLTYYRAICHCANLCTCCGVIANSTLGHFFNDILCFRYGKFFENACNISAIL